ncbi:hypothetical protein QWJ26_22070 [Streptomyces sp. CSDS2]|uniref:hypothetical protein n=1 Tax=Streptomyces sp. CSDS2 TaxID=3055051 RepID=UPI0025B195AB|nr:hypothetical protein [Streptomyces sp. CSDS2]MDN3262445.1 hypothetical protein [Streptomyces sp. CSDS2]
MISAEDLVGKRLLQVTTSWHHYQDTEPSLLHMWWHMDGLGPVRFHTPGDGLSMEIDEPHGPYDMGEYGHTTVEADLPGFPVTRFVGRQVLAVRETRCRHGDYDVAVGLAARFPNGTIRVLNLADELVLAQDRHLGPVEEHLHEATPSTSPGRLTLGRSERHGQWSRLSRGAKAVWASVSVARAWRK